MENKMFCFQCEQTAGCSGCTGNAGVCGKTAETANLQDELTGALIGLAKACESNPHDESVTDIIVEGQTSGEWISVGQYKLSKGMDNYVRISNEEADGVVVADAVLFIPATDN